MSYGFLPFDGAKIGNLVTKSGCFLQKVKQNVRIPCFLSRNALRLRVLARVRLLMCCKNVATFWPRQQNALPLHAITVNPQTL